MTIPQDEARRRLRAAGYTLVGVYYEGTSERWDHPVLGELRLSPELDGSGDYEETMILLAEALAGG